MKKNIVIEVVSYLFFLLFMYTAITKFITFKTFSFDLGRDPLLENYSTLLAILIPLSEVLVSILLFLPNFRKIGMYATLFLMASFTLYVAYILAYKNEDRHCTCGGFIRELSWRQHLWFNILLTLTALIGVLKLRHSEKLNSKSLA